MSMSHVAGWTSESPTPAQLKEFFAQIASGRITGSRLQGWLRGALTAPVNYDDPEHHRIERAQYVNVDSGLGEADFPITRTGRDDVTFVIIECNSWQEYFDKVKAAGNLCAPDIAETRDFHKVHPEERMKGWLGAPCGSVSQRLGEQRVAYLYAHAGGLALGWDWLDVRWPLPRRCLVVCK